MSLQPLVDRIAFFVDLSQEDAAALLALPFTRLYGSYNRDVISRGERPSYLYVVLEGWAAKYNLRPEGSRRINGLMLPGNFCGLHAICRAPMEHGITALTNCTFARVDWRTFEEVAFASPAIMKAVYLSKLVDEETLRRWLLNSTGSFRSLAHLLCEIDARLHPNSTANQRQFKLPLTQDQIGDMLSITPVHINRTFRHLREAGLATMEGRTLRIPDVASLRLEASFNPGYLYAGA